MRQIHVFAGPHVRPAVTRFGIGGYWRGMETNRVLAALVLVGPLAVAGCADNGNDVGYENSAGTGGNESGGSNSRAGSAAGGSSSGTAGVAPAGGGGSGGSGGGSGGVVTGGTGGTGGVVIGGTSGTGGGAAGGTGGVATGGTGGEGGVVSGGAGGTGGLGAGGEGGAVTGGTGGVVSGGAGGLAGGAGGTGGSDCPPLLSCNWCDGDELLDGDGCVTGWICLNGDDPCGASTSCSDDGDCEPGEYCGDDHLCWPDPVTYLNVSEFAYVANPCTTDPCLPGVVAAVEQYGETYVISIDGHWVDSTYDWETNFDFKGALDGQTTMAEGRVTYRTDVNGQIYMEIELSAIYMRTF